MSGSGQIVIIGAGPAGCAAAVQCKRLGQTPVLLDRTGCVGGLVKNAFSIENYPALEPTSGPEFVRLLGSHISRFGLDVLRGNATGLSKNREGFALTGDFGELNCRCVILAVGTSPNPLDVLGAQTANERGLFYEVCEFEGTSKEVLVIGGGEAALDYSLSLSRKSAKVTIIVRGSSLRASGRLVDCVEKSSLINIEYNTCASSIHTKNDGVEVEVSNAQGRSLLSVDAVFAAVGRHRATTEILKGLDVDLSGALSTRIPGLFIVGDARTGSLGQAGMAIGDGLAAAQEAARFLLDRGFEVE